MSHQSKTRYIRHGMNTLRADNQLRSLAVEHSHGSYSVRNPLRLSYALLERSCNHSRADWLRQDQSVSHNSFGIRKYAFGIDQARYCISELDFRITNAVPAYDDTAGLRHFRHAALHDLLQHVQIAIRGKAHDRQGRDRTASHCVDVTEGICGGNLTESRRVIDQRSKEIQR